MTPKQALAIGFITALCLMVICFSVAVKVNGY
jgi:hypothetical protein